MSAAAQRSLIITMKHSLPSVILHHTCSYLVASDMTNFRLVCKIWACVGLQYLIPHVHLLFLPKSLDRLRIISEHPVLSKGVKKITYEGDTFEWFESISRIRRRFDGLNRDPAYIAEFPALVSSATDDDSLMLYREQLEKAKQRPLISRAWQKQQDLHIQQASLQRTTHDFDIIAKAISRFPRLKCVDVITRGREETPSATFLDAYEGSLTLPRSNVGFFPCGKRQLLALLKGALAAGTKLQEIRTRRLSWAFFESCQVTQAEWEIIVRDLRVLCLDITLWDRSAVYHTDTDDWKLEKFEEKGYFRSFLIAAPNLEELTISLDTSIINESVAKFDIVVDSFVWHQLRSVRLNGLEVQENHLVNFFKCHAQTLRVVGLEYMYLKGGSWNSFFQRFRGLLDLEEISLKRSFLADPDEEWDMTDGLPGNDNATLGKWLEQQIMLPSSEPLGLDKVMAH